MLDMTLDSFNNSLQVAEQMMKARLAENDTPAERSTRQRKKLVGSSKTTSTPRRNSLSNADNVATGRNACLLRKRNSIRNMSSALMRRRSSRRLSASNQEKFETEPTTRLSSSDQDNDVSSVVSDISTVSASDETSFCLRSSLSSRSLCSTATTAPVFAQSMVIHVSWEKIKAIPDYQELLGEQIILRMMEMDPLVRKDLGLTSLRSERCQTLSTALVTIVDEIVCVVGPDVDDYEEDFVRLGKQCTSEGIQVALLGDSLSEAVKLVLKEHGDTELCQQDIRAWKSVFDFVSTQMARHQTATVR